jgi:hypothetical protein
VLRIGRNGDLVRLAHRIVLLGLATTLKSALLSTCVAAQPSTAESAAQPQRLTGMVSRIDVPAGTLDLLTGVGHALRLHRVLLPGTVKVEARGASSEASALSPGCVVRVVCSSTPAGTVASAVQLLQTPAELARR